MISSIADRRWHMEQTRPIGCATLGATEARSAFAAHRAFFRVAFSRARRVGSARRRRIHSRLLLRRRVNSSQVASRPQFASSPDSCARSSSTVASAIRFVRLGVLASWRLGVLASWRLGVFGSLPFCVSAPLRLCPTLFIRFACRCLPGALSRRNRDIISNRVGTKFSLPNHGSSPFSSSTATPVL